MQENSTKEFVSRAGQKLQHALTEFNIDVKNKTCADLGSCTGGFVDCLIQNNAKKVFSVDVSYGSLDWKLRQDPEVIVMERTNALHVELPEKVDFISIDVGWTKQKLIIPHALTLLKENGNIVSLLKPHYEADKNHLKSGKVDEQFIDTILQKVKNDLSKFGCTIKKIIKSPIIGQKGGNVEYLMWVVPR